MSFRARHLLGIDHLKPDEIVFGTDNSHKWQAALKSLGIDPTMLSAAAGHA